MVLVLDFEEDALVLIFKHLTFPDLGRVAAVNKTWNRAAQPVLNRYAGIVLVLKNLTFEDIKSAALVNRRWNRAAEFVLNQRKPAFILMHSLMQFPVLDKDYARGLVLSDRRYEKLYINGTFVFYNRHYMKRFFINQSESVKSRL